MFCGVEPWFGVAGGEEVVVEINDISPNFRPGERFSEIDPDPVVFLGFCDGERRWGRCNGRGSHGVSNCGGEIE
jgi:hypothetical protein